MSGQAAAQTPAAEGGSHVKAVDPARLGFRVGVHKACGGLLRQKQRVQILRAFPVHPAQQLFPAAGGIQADFLLIGGEKRKIRRKIRVHGRADAHKSGLHGQKSSF